jgi:hypothetical protein
VISLIFKIDGTDITPYIAYNGISWQREDIDGPNAGRDLNGNLIRDRVATKYRADITCRPLDPEESAILFTLIAPEWITVVTDTNPYTGSVETTYTMYSNNIKTNVVTKTPSGELVWGGLTVPLIQQ